MRFLVLMSLVLVLAGCNLSATTPTPTFAPPTATDIPLVLPTAPGGIPSPQAAINPNCPATPPTWVQYTIEPGDSLGLLASQTDSTIDDLVRGNCLNNPDAIAVGEIIYLPNAPVVS
jgi:hypothetical protein